MVPLKRKEEQYRRNGKRNDSLRKWWNTVDTNVNSNVVVACMDHGSIGAVDVLMYDDKQNCE